MSKGIIVEGINYLFGFRGSYPLGFSEPEYSSTVHHPCPMRVRDGCAKKSMHILMGTFSYQIDHWLALGATFGGLL